MPVPISVPIAVTIAGSDPSGGAGIQADLKTFSALNVYGASIITALTAQNTHGVYSIHTLPADFIHAQIKAVFSDLDVKAVKIGMLADADVIRSVARGLEQYYQGPIILDPVMVATVGDNLLNTDAEQLLKSALIPKADLITPNLYEAAKLLGQPQATNEFEMKEQVQRLIGLRPKAVLLKGGHLATSHEAIDMSYDGAEIVRFTAPYIETKNTHGTGCTLSSAIAAFVAQGQSWQDAIELAKAYITKALEYADSINIGSGAGPVCHNYKFFMSKSK